MQGPLDELRRAHVLAEKRDLFLSADRILPDLLEGDGVDLEDRVSGD
jgi:hypothetical protein